MTTEDDPFRGSPPWGLAQDMEDATVWSFCLLCNWESGHVNTAVSAGLLLGAHLASDAHGRVYLEYLA
jgi:hypothetical protein